MSAAVLARSMRERGTAMVVGAVSLGLFLLFAMAVYRDVDLSLYSDLPPALRDVLGIPADADVASLSYNVLFGTTAALTLATLTIFVGAAAGAGEERGGTAGLLLANPVSRGRVVISKVAAMVTLVAVAGLLLWAAALAVPAVLGVALGSTRVGAMVLHMSVNALFYGALAVAVAARTGRSATASAVAAGVMFVSFVAAGLLPLVDAIAGARRAVPWYYFDGSEPLRNGIGWGHLLLLAGGAAVLIAVAVVAVDRRDLTTPAGRRTLLDRLRSAPLSRFAAERLAGTVRVSGIWAKSGSEHQAVLFVTAALMFWLMGVLMGPMYSLVDESLIGFADQLPEALLALFGRGDISTPEGWFQLETFGLMAPIAVIVVTAVVGTGALAGEQARSTMGLLLANPVSRRRVVLENTATMVLFASVVGLATFAGTALGAVLAGLDISLINLGATSLLVTLLGLVFGALALALGAATGRVRAAAYGTVGVALVAYLANGLLPLSDRLAGLARWSPFWYYLGADPLVAGMPWGHAAVLAGLAVVLVAAAVVAFDRRDLRAG